MKREDVVDEQQHVGAQFVAEVLGHRDAGLRDAKAHARRFVHLAEHERRLCEHTRLFHLDPEVVAFTRAFADAGEHGEAFVHLRDVADQLLNEHRLADTRTAEETDLTAARVGGHQVDDLDAGFEDLRRRILRDEVGRRTVDRPVRGCLDRLVGIDRLAEHVENAPECPFADRNRDRGPGVGHRRAAHETVGRTHREAAHLVVAQFVLHFERQVAGLHRGAAQFNLSFFAFRVLGVQLRDPVASGGRLDTTDVNRQRIVNIRQRLRRELDVNDVAEHLHDFTGRLGGLRGIHTLPLPIWIVRRLVEQR